MTRIGLVAFGLLLVACKHSKPAEGPIPGDDPKDTAACEALDETGCRARSDCAPITAQQEDGNNACLLAEQVVGCHAADTACADAITYATDDDGAGWWFMDTCVPQSFGVGVAPESESVPPPAC